jgi:hypothetical protein
MQKGRSKTGSHFNIKSGSAMKNNKTLCPSDSGHNRHDGSFKGVRGGSDDDSSEDASIFEKESFLGKDD